MAVISVLVFQSSPLKTCLAVDGSTCFACFTVTPANLTRHVFYGEGLLFDFAELEYLKFVAAWNKRDLPGKMHTMHRTGLVEPCLVTGITLN